MDKPTSDLVGTGSIDEKAEGGSSRVPSLRMVRVGHEAKATEVRELRSAFNERRVELSDPSKYYDLRYYEAGAQT